MRIRGNSHYRNLCGGTISRNAYRSVVRGRLLGRGECFCVVLYIKRKDIKTKMKTKFKNLTVVCCLLLAVVIFLGCTQEAEEVKPVDKRWENATYLENTELGKGDKTVVVEVEAGEYSIEFTIHTDKTNLGDALLEHKLIEGDESQYGLYVKKVNGILADYDVDQTYWGFYKNGEMMMVGVSSAEFSDGEHYELVLES